MRGIRDVGAALAGTPALAYDQAAHYASEETASAAGVEYRYFYYPLQGIDFVKEKEAEAPFCCIYAVFSDRQELITSHRF